MTHDQKRIYLIRQLLAEKPEYEKIPIPAQEKEQKDLPRSLMHVRMPKPDRPELLKLQDENFHRA